MIKLLRLNARLVTNLLLAMTLLASMANFSVAAAASSASASQECVGISQISNVPCSEQANSSQTDTNSLIHTVVLGLSEGLGAIAVIMLIVGGFIFSSSAGDASRVKTAKDTLLYALIGLAIAVLAQIIVRWVIGSANNIGNGTIVPGFVRLLHHLY